MKKLPRHKKSVKPRGTNKTQLKSYDNYFDDWVRAGKPDTFIQWWQSQTGVTPKNNIEQFNNMMKWLVYCQKKGYLRKLK